MKIFPENFTIGAIAPAGAVAADTVRAGVEVLENLGATVRILPNVRRGDPILPYLDSPDPERAADLEQAWLDPEIDMLWAIRGGYGCGRLLAALNWEKLATRNIPVAGFSDITALHWAMSARNCGTILAMPMFSYLKDADEATLLSLQTTFQKQPQILTLPALRGGKISGLPLPGNLTVAASLCGTPFFPDTTGKVIILEEVGEHPYRIDRTLNQLLMCGTFDHCAGVVFGRFTSSGSLEIIMKILEDFTRKVDVPVFCNLEYGHELPFVSIRGDLPVSVSGW